MQQPQTWRELLNMVIGNSHERLRVAAALGVNPVTLIRWATNKSTPRLENLRFLLDALPEYRQSLTHLLAIDYPQIAQEDAEMNRQEILANFYASILNLQTTIPPLLRTSAIGEAILQQMLDQLDPHHLGMAIFIAQCVPPSPGKKVRSLHNRQAYGSTSWARNLQQRAYFFGAESDCGHVLTVGHQLVKQNYNNYALGPTGGVASSVATPILQGDQAAGTLMVISTQPDYFSPAQRILIQHYAHLLILGFEPEDFYSLHEIELGIMPFFEAQKEYVQTFQDRLQGHLIQAAKESRLLTSIQAEILVWQELEAIILQASFKNFV